MGLGFFSLLRLISMVPGNLAMEIKWLWKDHRKKKKESSTVPASKAQEGPGITSLQQADSSTEIQANVGKSPVLNQWTRIIYCCLLSFLFELYKLQDGFPLSWGWRGSLWGYQKTFSWLSGSTLGLTSAKLFPKPQKAPLGQSSFWLQV